MNMLPRLLLTMGDVAGIGPEVIARAWPDLHELCRPVVVGDPGWMRQALRLTKTPAELHVIDQLDFEDCLLPLEEQPNESFFSLSHVDPEATVFRQCLDQSIGPEGKLCTIIHEEVEIVRETMVQIPA